MRRPRSAAEAGPLVPPATEGTGEAAAPKPRTSRARRARARPVGVSTTGWSLVGTPDLIELCRMVHATVARDMDATIFVVGLYDGASQTVEVVWQIEDGAELPGGSF